MKNKKNKIKMSEINSKLCEKLEKIIFVDPGQRGVSKCWIHGCLFDAATKLLKCDKTKSIISLNKLITIPLGKDLFKRYRSLDKRI